jgi:ferredoxin-NADP reductase
MSKALITPENCAQTLLVAGRTNVAENIVVLDLHDPAGAELAPWTPGAHIDRLP